MWLFHTNFNSNLRVARLPLANMLSFEEWMHRFELESVSAGFCRLVGGPATLGMTCPMATGHAITTLGVGKKR
jgi:hypothetical protein